MSKMPWGRTKKKKKKKTDPCQNGLVDKIGSLARETPVMSQIIQNSSGKVVGTGLALLATFLYFFLLGFGRETVKIPVGV